MEKRNLFPLQKEILKFFGQDNFGKNFYWTGGTLLSYYYFHHRISKDLDFFSDDLFSEDQYLFFINRLKKKIQATKVGFTQEYNRRIYFIRRQKESIKIELVYFPFKSLEKRKVLPEFSLKIDSLTDIMTNKTLSAYQRKEPKDVFDLYFYFTHYKKYDFLKDLFWLLLLLKHYQLGNLLFSISLVSPLDFQ